MLPCLSKASRGCSRRVGDYRYAGSELPLFEAAHNWKRYFRGFIEEYLQGHVLEVGAGLGATTRLFADVRCAGWVCIEPDPMLAAQLRANVAGLPGRTVIVGTMAALDRTERFDTVLYIDVLEHIADDRAELAAVAAHLNPGGVIVLLAPAQPWLYSPFDRAVGHCRRYTKGTLARAVPASLRQERLCYLDSAGLLASLGNRLMLRSRTPNAAQIRVWDRMLVPVSRWTDKALGFKVGKSVVGVWRAPS